ncbi:hypothetical protein B0H13DRAFT_2414883, partial [Mycena leptocephala]
DSDLRLPLTIQLFRALLRPTTESSLTVRIIRTTAHLINKTVITPETQWHDIQQLMTEISQFCSTVHSGHDSLPVLVSAAALARVESPEHFENIQIKGQNLEWIFSSLEYVQQLWEEGPHQGTEEWDSTTTLSVGSLLQFLICSSLPLQPPLRSLHMILRALSAPGDTSQMAAQLLYCAPRNWFLDPNLQSIMQESSVWTQLGYVTLEYSHSLTFGYFCLAEDIAEIAEWKPIIYEDLVTWIMIFVHAANDIFSYTDLSMVFVSVIRSIWVPEFSDQMKLVDKRNKSWILALTALANVWNTFQISSIRTLACLRLARCTVSISLRVYYFDNVNTSPIPSDIRAAFTPQLGQALIRAAANARNTLTGTSPSPIGDTASEESHSTAHPFERIAALLDALGGKVSSEFETTSGEVQLGGATRIYTDWEELQKHFEAELNVLEESLLA